MIVEKYKHTFQCLCKHEWVILTRDQSPSRDCPKCNGSVTWVWSTEAIQAELMDKDIQNETNELLAELPEELRSVVSYMAYESGHSAGEMEVLSILRGLVDDLKGPLEKLRKNSYDKGVLSQKS